MRRLYVKYKELIAYAFFGGLTTLINSGVYAGLDALHAQTWLSVGAAWAVSVAFAFVTNRKWVFHGKPGQAWPELRRFVVARLFTLALDLGLMYLFTDVLGVSGTVMKTAVKLGVNVLVIILNYVFSKLIVFKK